LINVSVMLGDGDSFAYTADAAAAQVLAALGGNPTEDSCYVSVQQSSDGHAGVQPPPQEP
jgi:hypothetical protein